MRVVIAGGTGFLGRALAGRLVRDGHDVAILSRGGAAGSAADGARAVAWTPNGDTGPWAAEIDGADAVVNLAGAGIADRRWTEARKRRLHDSRVLSTRSLAAAVRAARVKPRVFIQCVAVGIYGAHPNGATFDESSGPGTDFLAQLCVAWEAAAQPVAAEGCRVVILRSGVVLSRRGGALAKMLPAFHFFVGGRIASGRQYMSWIHLDDWVGMTIWTIENPAVSGPVNAAAPQPVTNAEFSRALGRALHRPSWAPVPGFVLNVVFGEMATDCLILGQRVVPARAIEMGYQFKFGHIDEALADAVRH
jgi:uncharacterized protein (TIGR01777 family)